MIHKLVFKLYGNEKRNYYIYIQENRDIINNVIREYYNFILFSFFYMLNIDDFALVNEKKIIVLKKETKPFCSTIRN